MGLQISRNILSLLNVIGTIFVVCTGQLNVYASTCISPEHLANPGLDSSVKIIEFYEQTWDKWLSNTINVLYKHNKNKSNLLNKVYEKANFKLIFFDHNLLPKQSVNVLLRHILKLRDLENKHFLELNNTIQELDAIKRALTGKSMPPEEAFKSNVKFCLSKSTTEKVYIGGLIDDPVVENRLKQWAYNRIDWLISLMSKISKADIQLTAMLFQYVNYINPFVLEKINIYKYTETGKSLDSYLNSLHPRNHHYQILLKHLGRYKNLANVEQITIKKGPSLKMGMTGANVLDLQKRLSQEGYLPKDSITGVFDASTERAVKLFQETHFLKPDGVVGPKTKTKLNIPFSTKYEWMKLSIDRLRNCPCRILDRYVWVNIPTFTLEYHSGKKLISTHKVIVGKATGGRIRVRGTFVRRNNTLPLISEIKAIVFMM